MKVSALLVRKPIFSFFALAYLLSWIIWIPLLVIYFLNPFPPFPLPLSFLFPALLGAFGPTFAALIMANAEGGREEVKKLLSRWRIWRVEIKWYIIIPLITYSIAASAINLYLVIFNVTPQVNLGLWYLPLLYFVSVMVGGPICEETGWRGYALPKLQESNSALNSSLIIGIPWTFWHIPAFLIPGMALPPVPLDFAVVLNYLLRVISLSILFTWIFNNTRGSLLLAFLFHAAVNSSMATLLQIFSFELVGTTSILSLYWFSVVIQWILAIVIVLLSRATRLSRKHLPNDIQ